MDTPPPSKAKHKEAHLILDFQIPLRCLSQKAKENIAVFSAAYTRLSIGPARSIRLPGLNE